MPKGKVFEPALQRLRNKPPQEGFFSTLDELIDAAPTITKLSKMIGKLQQKSSLSPPRLCYRSVRGLVSSTGSISTSLEYSL